MGLFDRLARQLDALARDGRLPPEARAELDLAAALIDRGELAEAEARLDDLTTRFPGVAELHARLGMVRAARGADEAAVPALGRAVDLDGGEASFQLALGQALARLGRTEPAADALRRALHLSRTDDVRLAAHRGLGRMFLALGQSGRAVRELRAAAALDADRADVLADLGRALLADGDPEGTSHLVRAAELPGASVDLVLDAAEALHDDAAAERVLRHACTERDDVRLRARLAALLCRMGRTAEALPMALQASAEAPGEPAGPAALVEVFAHAGRPDEALAAARDCEARGGELPAARWLALGLAAGDRQAVAEAARRWPAEARDGDAVRAFAQGAPTEAEAVAVALAARDDRGRRFALGALAPPPLRENDVVAALERARDLAVNNPELLPLAPPAARAVEAFDRPLLVAVMGEFNAGKSSFVNAIAGQEVAPVGATPTTATVNVLRHGPPGGRVVFHDGGTRDLSPPQLAEFLRHLPGDEAARVRMVEMFFPIEALRRVEIVDTPGWNALRPEHEKVARAFLREADALVWLFSVGQAAKATEEQALKLAHAARRRVLGVLNKTDVATPAEVDEVLAHVRGSLGDLLEDVLPLSARAGLAARRAGDDDALAASGLPAVQAAIESRFFAHARALKRATALEALRRFATEARAASPAPSFDDGAHATQGEALARDEQAVRGALAAARVAWGGRIDELCRQVAFEVAASVRPRGVLPGGRPLPADRAFVRDLIDDGITRAARESLARATAAGGAQAGALAYAGEPEVARFTAYLRGVLDGGVLDDFLGRALPALGADVAALKTALVRRLPDPDDEFFMRLGRVTADAFAQARAAQEAAWVRARVTALAREARLDGPLRELESAVARLAEGTESAAA